MSKILVIEDDSATRLFLKKDLQREGYDVTAAKDGAEGLLLAQQQRPTLIVCDWVMPQMDGVEVCRQVKADPNLAIAFFILLTSRESVAHRVEGLDAGADEFISKPIDPNELQARARAGLRQYQLAQQLSQTNQQLSQTLQELQQAQARLIQSEKMSSLGQLVAGIAHEINNPVTFIDGNLNHAKNYIQDLLGLLQLYQKHYPEPHPEISAEAVAIDLEFLTQDLYKLLASMKTGSQRIRQIVLSLRNFSRLDESEFKQVDLHEGLENALLILQHRLQPGSDRAEIQVIKEYGELPKVECSPGELNQVFLNILANAVDAIEEGDRAAGIGNGASSSRPDSPAFSLPTIRIRTEVKNSNWAVIRIADSGKGMTEDVRQKLFDPFFTTKPVGRGTGMSLSIGYQTVVEKHGGNMHCISAPGKGTEFILEIPISRGASVSPPARASAKRETPATQSPQPENRA